MFDQKGCFVKKKITSEDILACWAKRLYSMLPCQGGKDEAGFSDSGRVMLRTFSIIF